MLTETHSDESSETEPEHLALKFLDMMSNSECQDINALECSEFNNKQNTQDVCNKTFCAIKSFCSENFQDWNVKSNFIFPCVNIMWD